MSKMKNKRNILYITFSLVFIFFINTFAYADINTVIRSASEYDYPPFCTVTKDGKADGFSVELLRAVLQKVDLGVEFKIGPWAEIKKELEDGNIQVLPLVGRTPEREKIYDFTFTYLRLHGAIFVRKGDARIETVDDLADKEIIVMEGDNAEEYVKREHVSPHIVKVETYEKAMILLESGKHDAVIVQRLMGIQLLKNLGISEVVPVEHRLNKFRQDFSFAVREGDKELLALLNEGLSIARADGTFERLHEKWFVPILGRRLLLKDVFNYALIFGVPIILFILVSFTFFLRAEVKRKTKGLHQEIEERKRAEEELQKVKDELEVRVEERTIKLRSTVELLQNEVNERKNAEEELHKSEERYRHITESITDYIYTVQLKDGKYVDTIHGENCFAVTGYTSDELSADGDLWIQMVVEEDRDIMLQQLEDVYLGRYPLPVELRIMRKDGVVPWVEIVVVPFNDLNGNLVSYDGLMRDITKRKRLEEQLLHAQKMESIGILAGGVAHDFNNILTAILGFSNILSRKIPEDSPLRSHVDHIEAAAESAAVLTKDLLTFSRKQRVNLMPLNFNVLIIRLKELLFRLIGENIEFKTILAEGNLHVMVDLNQMQQVLMNLVSNARDAMPGGGVLTITTESFSIDNEFIQYRGFGKPGPYVRVSISDTGMGMDEKTREKMFEPFFTLKEVDKGTGLGLSIVYGIIKQHKGYIYVESKPGEGTTFIIYLPAVTQAVKDVDRQTSEISAAKGGTETILVAEDNPMVMTVIDHTLTECGYRVITAEDGDEAVIKFKENQDSIQFIISDVVMPKKSGVEVYEEIKKIRPDIKCLFLSGYTPEKIHHNDIAEHGASFMMKPIKPDDLLRKVRVILNNST